MSKFSSLLGRFAKDESGVFAVIFGVMAMVLIALGGAVVDYVTLEQTRNRAQTALDAAALALQSEINRDDFDREDVRLRAQAIVRERIGDARVSAEVDRIDVTPDSGRLFLSGHFTLPTTFVTLVGVHEMSARFSSEAVRGSSNLEVSLALDVTGSMDNGRIQALQAATTELIETVLQNNAGETYAKVALVPYSQAVNAGSYADAIRGPIRKIARVNSVAWRGQYSSMRATANANNRVRIEIANHGLANSNWVYFRNSGISGLDNVAWEVLDRQPDHFFIRGVASGKIDSKGEVAKCVTTNCDPQITARDHGYADGESVYFENLQGITDFNGNYYALRDVTKDTFVLRGASFNRNSSHTANTGQFYCTWQSDTVGCPYYSFENVPRNTVRHAATTCVTERRSFAFSDQPPSHSFMGRNYPNSANGCLPSKIVPLTDNKETLLDEVDDFVATGSTSGSLGILWGWYMLAPNLGYIWPEASRPAPYGEDHLIKALVIMTDGEFNTVHNDGVVARNSGVGSYSYSDRRDQINKTSFNGDAYNQARGYCDALKAPGNDIVVFTVGFGISAGSNAANILSYCASESQNAFLANDAAGLQRAFRQIARNISELRLTL